MKVLFAGAEAVPFAKAGGLGDVIGSLPGELKEYKVDARVIMPKYGEIPAAYKERMEVIKRFAVSINGEDHYCGIESMEFGGVIIYFIDNEYYFNRQGIYGHYDDGERFAFFCKSVLESLPLLDFEPDIIHCHDWHASMINILLNEYKKNPLYSNIRSVLTIHNLHYQGIFPKDFLKVLELGDNYFSMDKLEFYGKINCLKGGIVFSDAITTVSETYAKEILTPYFGENLHGFLEEYDNKLYGIINGIDNNTYNPATDGSVFMYYDKKSLENKLINKRKLQGSLGFAENENIPLIGIVSRLTTQKGFDLVECVLDEILALDVQIVILGTGDERHERFFLNAAEKHPDKLSANIYFDNVLAHRIYAGSDLFLMPSLFEPCGIGQMIALRYGTIPLVRATGGLKDTVIPFNSVTGKGNGFTFDNFNAHEMFQVLQRALDIFHNKELWDRIRHNALDTDNSWTGSASRYHELYHSLIV